MNQFDWPITTKKKLKLWRLPKINDSMEKRKDFGQNIWDYSEVLLGTPLGNTLGTHWEFKKHIKNLMGT